LTSEVGELTQALADADSQRAELEESERESAIEIARLGSELVAAQEQCSQLKANVSQTITTSITQTTIILQDADTQTDGNTRPLMASKET
jgi:hypothetical protein